MEGCQLHQRGTCTAEMCPLQSLRGLQFFAHFAALSDAATPTAYHRAIASLVCKGRVRRWYTQVSISCDAGSFNDKEVIKNVNGTQLQSLADAQGHLDNLVHLHGLGVLARCAQCGWKTLAVHAVPLWTRGLPAVCQSCSARAGLRSQASTRPVRQATNRPPHLRPDMTLYADIGVPSTWLHQTISAVRLDKSKCKALLIVGTSLGHEVRDTWSVVTDLTQGYDADVVWINPSPPPAKAAKICTHWIQCTSEELAEAIA